MLIHCHRHEPKQTETQPNQSKEANADAQLAAKRKQPTRSKTVQANQYKNFNVNALPPKQSPENQSQSANATNLLP